MSRVTWTSKDLDNLEKRGIASRMKKVSEGLKKKSKYKNVKVQYEGMTFDSRKEFSRYLILKSLEDAGNISDLKRQVKFSLDVNGQHIANYVADFSYEFNGENVVEDVKSAITKRLPVYSIKKKLLKALYGVEIKET